MDGTRMLTTFDPTRVQLSWEALVEVLEPHTAAGADIVDADEPEPAGRPIEQARVAVIAGVLTTLHPREADVITLRFGLADGQPRSLDEIARVYGVTRERVRHVEATALAKLRNPLPAGILRAS